MANEINPFDDLDGRMAQKNYLGKSIAQVLEMLESNPGYAGDLMWMGPRAFAFYLPAVTAFVPKTTDPDLLNSVCGTLEFRLEHHDIPDDARGEVRRLCELIDKQYDRFHIEPDIYGDMKERFARVLRQMGAEPAVRR